MLTPLLSSLSSSSLSLSSSPSSSWSKPTLRAIILHLCTPFNQPRHHFAPLSSETLVLKKRRPFWHFSQIEALFWAQRSFLRLFASRRCTRVSSSLCQRPLQNFFPNLTFNFATFKQIASPFYLRILDAKTIWYNKIFQHYTNSHCYPHISHD